MPKYVWTEYGEVLVPGVGVEHSSDGGSALNPMAKAAELLGSRQHEASDTPPPPRIRRRTRSRTTTTG